MPSSHDEDPRMRLVGRKRGRPRIGQEPSASISTVLPSTEADQLIKAAHDRQITVAEFTRRLLRSGLRRL